jgi:NRAMP (natural resistance-associated macrophage protein)-like metal ion transporter
LVPHWGIVTYHTMELQTPSSQALVSPRQSTDSLHRHSDPLPSLAPHPSQTPSSVPTDFPILSNPLPPSSPNSITNDPQPKLSDHHVDEVSKTQTPSQEKRKVSFNLESKSRDPGAPVFTFTPETNTIWFELPDFSWKKLLKFMGPAFLVTIAYMDPGNLASDIQSGSQFSYSLIWVILAASGLGLFLQILSMKLGVITRNNLAALTAQEFQDQKYVKAALFVIAELTIVGSDVPEVVGTAIALKLLGSIPLYIGVLLTAMSVFMFLGLDRFGARYLELFIALLIGIVLFCFLAQLGLTHVPLEGLLGGFVPRIQSLGAMYSLIALLGSVVMPHNLYLHSGLVQSRDFGKSVSELKEACRYNELESSIAIGISVLVNMAVIAVAANSFFPNSTTGLNSAPQLLSQALGGSQVASYLFSVALLCSGQSSTMTGTFTGQLVMESFVQIKLSNFWRATVTRGLAILPSLIVSILYGDDGAENLIVFSQVFLSILLPFPLICLIKFTSDENLMGRAFMNGPKTRIIASVLGFLVTIANLVGIISLVKDPISSLVPASQVMAIVSMIIVFGSYVSFMIFLTRRPFRCERYSPTNLTFRPSVLKEMEEEELPEYGIASRYSYFTLNQLG